LKNPKNPLIYVIDTNPSYRKVISGCLSALNYRNIDSFSTIGDCLLANGTPDIIILDNEQGEEHLTGLEFFRVYRKRFQQTHFLFLSSDNNLDVAVDAIKMGAYDYIVKSKIGLERLIERVDKLVKVYRNDLKRKHLYIFTLLSLGVLCIVFITAVLLYMGQ
jgi:DNA-binding NtrC family response regulator